MIQHEEISRRREVLHQNLAILNERAASLRRSLAEMEHAAKRIEGAIELVESLYELSDANEPYNTKPPCDSDSVGSGDVGQDAKLTVADIEKELTANAH